MGFHFFKNSPMDGWVVNLLLNTWKRLKTEIRNQKFVIISTNNINVSLAYFKIKFPEEYNSIPWYKLPYDGRSLSRCLHVPLECSRISESAGHFVVMQKDKYQPLNYFARDALELYGIEAFPFTLERVVLIEKKKQQEMSMFQLLPTCQPLLGGGCSTPSYVVCALMMYMYPS